MINKFLTDIKIIKKAIATKKLVVFAGAGISIDAGVPSWGQLINEIKKDLDLPDYENDYLKIPQIYFNERQEKEYVEKIRSVLEHKKLKHNEIHEEIFELNPEHILTTNFEDLLEQVINKKSLPFSIVKKDNDLPYSSNTKLLVKIHGDLDDTDFVLKEDDYLNYSKNHPLIEAFINSVFASKVVLFIGYSFNDYNLKQIVQNVRNILGNNFQNAYLISIDKEIHTSHKLYLKNKGINVLNYFDAIYTDKQNKNSNYIEDFLNKKNIYSENYHKEVESLSEKGQYLLNFLRFIRYYDELRIEIEKENVLEQIHKSISRFSELKSLPQSFITKLYPFKITDKPEPLIQKTTLLLKNHNVVELFYNNLKIDNDKVFYNSNEAISDSKKKENEKKLKEIIIKLNNSLIFSVTTERKQSDSFGYKGFSNNLKNINLKKESKCNCTKCKYQRYQLNDVLTSLNSYSINEKSDIKEDLQIAYLNYKIGNYFLSYNMFEEIATKAWQTGKYLTYYISSKNKKSLKNLIRYNENLPEKKKEDLIKEINDIDIDKLIFQIPYNSDEELKLLITIRDDSVLQDYNNEIEELYSKVEELYINYNSNKYFNSYGPYYPQLIYIELYKVINFYVENYIIIDVFSDFKKAIQKGIKALILSHITSEAYNQKLDTLSGDLFRFTINYSNPSDLSSFLQKHKIDSLKFDKKEIENVIEYCINYFNSFFTKSKLFFNGNYKNQSIFNQLSNQAFGGNMGSIFSNMMLLLISIEIPEKDKTKFSDNLISFLEHEDFLHWNDLKYLKWLIEMKPSLLNRENCIKLLKIIQLKTKKYSSSDLIEGIAKVFDKNGFEPIDDKDFILKILSDFDYTEPNNISIIDLWHISNSNIKNELKSIIINRLNLSFNEKLYVYSCYDNIIDYNLFFEEYIKELNLYSPNNNEDIIEKNNGKAKLKNFVFHNAIIFIYSMKVKSNDERLKLIHNPSDVMKFFLFRKDSDLTLFKVEWLKLFDNKIILNEIGKIKELKTIIRKQLSEVFDEELSIIYTKYFI